MEQQQYYSSDEEIAWGPLTLREIKKEMKRQKRPEQIKRRQTERYIKPSLYDFLQDDNNKSDDKNVPSFKISNTELTLVENTIILSSESDCDDDVIEINSSKSSNEFDNSKDTNEINDLMEDMKMNSVGEIEVKCENSELSKNSTESDDLSCLENTEDLKEVSDQFECNQNELDCTLDVVNRILEGRLSIFNKDESLNDCETSVEISPVNSPQQSAFASINEAQFVVPQSNNHVNEFKTPRAIQKLSPATRNIYGNIISPVAQYIKSGIPQIKKRNPVKTGRTSPNPRNNYENIISPVAHYINKGPYTPLVQNVPTKTVTNLRNVKSSPKPLTPINTNVKNVEFPKVFYKPSKQTKVVESEEMHLPGNIQKLLPQKITIIKHEGRLKNTPTHIDSSVDLSMLDNTKDEDISVVTVKKTY